MITAKLGSIILTPIYRHITIITEAGTRTRIFNTLQVAKKTPVNTLTI